MLEAAYTVTQLTNSIKYILESQKSFQGFVLKGEISNFVRHRTGHLYFALKDENSQIRAIMFNGLAQNLNFDPKDGDKVTITGSISLYAPQGSYSVQVSKMQLDGAGELYLKYLELKDKLKGIGWFDKAKRSLPKFPKNIGVVTSPTGAVIEDITNTINRRYRLTNIILYPALVQGIQSASSISKAIEKANEDNLVDVLIVGRGGGSIEDLWGFNELATISAIYNSKIPVITAIGHETDDTISDLVSDLRAPTPTAAAELATPDTNELLSNIDELQNNITYRFNMLLNKHQNTLIHLVERLEVSSPKNKLENYVSKVNYQENLLKNYFNQILDRNVNIIKNLDLKLSNLSPKNKLNENKQVLNQYDLILNKNYTYLVELNNNKFNQTIKTLNTNYLDIVNNKKQNLNQIFEILKVMNPLAIMQRGFTVTKNSNNKIVTSINELNLEERIEVDFYDGTAYAKVYNKKEK